MGSIFRPLLKSGERQSTYKIKYYVDGQERVESTGVKSRAEAERILKEREGRVATGQPVAPRADRILVRELVDDLLNEYRANARRSLGRLEDSLGHIVPVFGHRRAQFVTTADVTAYVTQRQKEGAANATINRELAALKRMYRIAISGEKLYRRPHIASLKENNVRTGFFERGQFEAVRTHLPAYVQTVVTFAYITGWRIRSEVLTLQWRQVDFKAGTIRLEPGTTKNNEGRMFKMTPELRACLEAQRAATDVSQRERGQIISSVFHRNGRPFASFRKSWIRACRLAGTPGRIPHDFRRSAIRNLERAGVSRSVAMKMVGHKTESVYRRYAIVDESMLNDATEKLARLDEGKATQ